MLIVPRQVREIKEQINTRSEAPPQALQDYRDRTAWVLLGEPGAGKSEALKMEAANSGGLLIPISEFLIEDLKPEWKGKTLFLDGLDESRASGQGDSILIKIRSRLKSLGTPHFRIACRAADWFGSTDRASIASASPDGQLNVLLLAPLGDEDIVAILRQNHSIENPVAFVDEAVKRGVDDLLKNPQTLGLLAQAIQGEQWPETRQQTFELACQKLADEASKPHRDQLRSRPIPVEAILDAAGQLFAALLLSDKTGIALDRAASDSLFPALEAFSPPDLEMAHWATRRTLFKPSASSEERVVPTHRSVAEYLAARWLARLIDNHGLSLGRLLNLLMGSDDRTVAGLRGLYGWLALHCQTARQLLIDADALTVVIYGDVKPMSRADKQRVLARFKREAEQHTAFFWEVQTNQPFSALADPGLVADFIAVIDSKERNDAAQSFTDCVLEILAEGNPLPGLRASIKNVIIDETRWSRTRSCALRVWLKMCDSIPDALNLLDAISTNEIADNNDELAGTLLSHLYPENLEPENLLRYLHIPKEQNLTGSYSFFWEYELPTRAPESHLPTLLDQLALRSDLALSGERGECELHLNRMFGALLVRGVIACGENVSDERLFTWLGIGADEYGDIQREEDDRKAIAQWLSGHPDRYKALLNLCYTLCAGENEPRLCIYKNEYRMHGADIPDDIGLWHLDQASRNTIDSLAESHLFEAVKTLIFQHGCSGMTLELIEAWGEAHPDKKDWLKTMLAWDIPPWRQERAVRDKTYTQKRTDRVRERSSYLKKNLVSIQSGAATANLMYELAGVWLNQYTDTRGDTIRARFDSYCTIGEEVLAAAESGFRLCVVRNDLPTVSEIIDLSIRQKEHFIRKPCLVGMDLLWRQGVEALQRLSDDTLRRMIAFRLTYGADSTPGWFDYLVKGKPSLVAEVLIEYATTTLNAHLDFVTGIYPLAYDKDYREVARIAAPAILERFPLRTQSGQLHHLESLLKALLSAAPEQLLILIEKKVSLKSMDVAQKVYWLTAAMLLDSDKYEAMLWRYIGKSWNRANHLSGFLSNRFGDLATNHELSAYTIGKLIELLAPHAELDWSHSGLVNDAIRRGEHIRSLITRLSALGTEQAAEEIERLLKLPTLSKLKLAFEDGRYQLRLKQRETEFHFPPLAGVVHILANSNPTSAADLTVLTLDHLDDIRREIRQDNDDGFRAFWNVENKKPTTQREENLCRDVLLPRLRQHLEPYGIDCQPEGDYANDKRADLRLSYRNEFELPVEIKGEWHDSLWTSLRKQLIEQYAISLKTEGYGIYLVLWFGGEMQKAARDGGKKPRTPDELKVRLEALLDPSEKKRIFVRVLDVSWPNKN